MEKQSRGDLGEVVGRDEALEAAGVEDGEGDGIAVAGGEGADEEAVLADQGVDAQGVLGCIIIRR